MHYECAIWHPCSRDSIDCTIPKKKPSVVTITFQVLTKLTRDFALFWPKRHVRFLDFLTVVVVSKPKWMRRDKVYLFEFRCQTRCPRIRYSRHSVVDTLSSRQSAHARADC